MSKRARFRVMLVVAAILGSAYGEISDGWGVIAFAAGMFGVIAILVLGGMPWIEFARDGAFRRRPNA
jgi:hypothetical protein